MNLKKSIFVILLSILIIKVFSQQISFNRLYNPDNFTSGGGAILKKGNGYVVQTMQWSNNDILTFLELDSIGDTIKVVRFNNNSTWYGAGYGSFVHTHDGGFCFAGEIVTPSHFYNYFIKFDNNLDTLWTKKLLQTDTLQENERQLCETSDKGYVMVGEKLAGTSVTDVLLLKIDSLGNQLWKKTIATGGLSAGWQIKETPDKGFLIQGFKASIGNPFILKTDSAGNYKWYYSPNSQKYNGGGSIAITPEGDYLFAYGYNVSNYNGSPDDYLGKINIIKYNSNGGVIWNKFYDTLSIDIAPIKIEVLSNGNFYILSNYLVGEISGKSQTNALLMKFNSVGDSLWTQRYSYVGFGYSDNLLYDGIATNDGGFIGCGYVVYGPNILQQIWVVKTDSMGYAPGMQYLGIKETNPYTMAVIKAFPNPTLNQTTISYPQLNTEGELQIYNTLGQLVFEEKLSKASSQKEINIQSLKAGLYKVIVREKGIIKGQVGLVKE